VYCTVDDDVVALAARYALHDAVHAAGAPRAVRALMADVWPAD